MAILIALGSNRAHGRHGRPRQIVEAAFCALTDAGIDIDCRSRIHITAPLGPSQRRYANAAAAVTTDLPPGALLNLLHDIEEDLGRRRQRRWGARVLDLDLIAYHDHVRGGPDLYLPHPAMHLRRFVLAPMAEVAPTWRHPILGLTVRQMYARLTHRR